MSISGGLMSVSGRFGADTRQSLLREHEARPCRPPFRYTRTNNLHFAVIPGCTSPRSAGIDLLLVTAAIKIPIGGHDFPVDGQLRSRPAASLALTVSAGWGLSG